MNIQRKSRILIAVGFLFTTLQTLLCATLSNKVKDRHIVISNPLVCLVGISEYNTQAALPSVRKEMRQLYDLFHFQCRYEVRASFAYESAYAEKHKDLPEMELSLDGLNQFLQKSYEHLYRKSDCYDGLIFVFSGHGFSNNKYKCPLIATSDCRFQKCNNSNKYKLVGCKYFDDVKDQFIKLKKNHRNEKFVKIPKIFFNFSCQSKTNKNILFPVPLGEEEQEYSSFLEEKIDEKRIAEEQDNVLIFSTARPGGSSGVQESLHVVQFLSKKLIVCLDKKKDESLQDIWNYIENRTNIKGSHFRNSLSPNYVFFAPGRKIMDKKTKNEWLAAAQKGNLNKLKNLFKFFKINVNAKSKKGNNALHLACLLSDNVEMVTWLLDVCKIDIEIKGCLQLTPFFCAAVKGHLAIAKLLKERGANIHAKDKEGYNALHYVCTFSGSVGSVGMVKWLVDVCKIDIEAKGQYERTPFLCAAEKGRLSIAKLLKKRGANIHAKDKEGDNALHLTCALSGSVGMVKWLVDVCKIDIETKGQYQQTPFICASGKGKLAIAMLLKKRGANIHAKDKEGYNALHLACLGSGSVGMVKWLVDVCKIDIEAKGNYQKTPFLIAAENGKLELANLLKKRGANIHAKDKEGYNALHLACFYSGSVGMVKWLVDVCKIDIEAKGNYQKTPFLCAANKGQLAIAKLLKERGANINATDSLERNALHLACAFSGSVGMVKWLVDVCKIDIETKGYAQETPFLFAAGKGKLPIAKLLKERGANINATDSLERNALHLACAFSGSVGMVKWLVDVCKIDIETKGYAQETPFLIAAYQGKLAIAKLLKKRGANIHAKDKDGNNALHMAWKKGSVEMITWLLDECKINIETKVGWSEITPFLDAVEKGKLAIAKLLKDRGANIHAKDKRGKNALHLACENGSVEMITWLLDQCKINIEAKVGVFERTPFLDAVENGKLGIAKLLKDRGANIHAKDNDGNNALHMAWKNGSVEMITWLLDECKINIETKVGWFERTPFLDAVENGKLGIAKLLKDRGANIHAKDNEGDNALHMAWKNGSVEMITWLLDECKIDIEAKVGVFERTPFLCAAKKGQLGIAKLLKDRRANIHAKDKDGNNALHMACKNGSIEMITWLLDECKINIEAKVGWFERTPFLDAAENGKLGIAKLLKDRGANINAKDKDGNNALHMACKNGSIEMITWLLDECKINIEAKGQYQRTPFLCAAQEGQLGIAKLLKDRGANIHAKDKDGNNALHMACKNGSVEMITWLLDECKINIEAKGQYERTPFIYCVEKGKLGIAKLLKDRGANIHAKDKDGDNALHEACKNGSVEMITWLLDECKINIEAKGQYERTPFLFAASSGQLGIAKLLKKRGANIHAKSKSGNNALHFACLFSESEAIVNWLLDVCKIGIETKGDAQTTPFVCAAEKGQLAIAKLLKKRGANIHAKSKSGNNALHEACLFSESEAIVNWLLDVCKIGIETKGDAQTTPFVCAAEKGQLAIAKLLKKQGANIHAKDKDGNNALHMACKNGSVEMITWLLDECKINIEAKGQYERTPFLFAANKGQLKIGKLLRQRGANINAKNNFGDNALHRACLFSGSEAMVTWLLDVCKIGIESKGQYQKTPFLCAAMGEKLAIAKLLKKQGANIHAKDKDGNNALHAACKNGSVEMITWLLDECKLGLESKGYAEMTPFLCAAAKGQLAIAKLLKKQGANIHATDEHGNNALYWICYLSGNVPMVTWLLDECKINIEAKVGVFERTPFLDAVENGKLGIAKLLKERGANIHAKDKDGKNALHLAWKNGSVEMITWLLDECKINIESKGQYQRTSFIYSVENGKLGIAKLLKDRGANIHAKDKFGKNALHLACENGSVEMITWLLDECKINIESKGQYQRTPFIDCVEKGKLGIAKLLKDRGANIHAKDKDGNNALHLAWKNGSVEMITWLLDECKINIETKVGWFEKTPFLDAVENGKLLIAKLLKDRGANIHAKDKDGNNALHMAWKKGSVEMITWLLDECKINIETKVGWSEITPFLDAVEKGKLAIAKLLKDRGANIHAKDKRGKNALHLACENGSVEMITWLLDECKINIEAKVGVFERTPFLDAVENGKLGIAKLLKDRGANIHAKDNDGNNALHLACKKGSVEMITWLLDECKINIESKEEYERTPFLDAAEKGQLPIAKLLKERDANIHAKDKYGNNALHLACKNGSVEMINWLLDECKINIESKVGRFERTPFLDAVEEGKLPIAKLLKERGADIHADKYGDNALHLAWKNGSVEMITWLLDECKINIETKVGGFERTPFLDAVENGKLLIAKLLKDRGANIHAKDKDGNNALHLACYYSGSEKMVTWLLDECKIGIETKEQEYEKTSFICAAEKGKLAIAKLLKERGANIHAKDKYGDNALHYACLFSGSVDMITWLLDECKLGLESKGYAEKTPFLCAAEKGQLAIAKLLKERGANIHAKSKSGNNALHYACLFSGSVEMITWLLDECKLGLESKGFAQRTPFLCAAEKGQLAIAKLLKERKANIYAKDKYGNNALHLACYYSGSEKMVTWLLDECKIGIETKEQEYEKTSFICAAEKGKLAIAKLLKERGANIYAKIENGSNALHFACQSSGNVEMVNWLLDICKLQKEARGGNQKTPFLWAADGGQLGIVKLLRERGANIYAKSENGNNALHEACLFSGSEKMVTWLLDECKIDIETKGYEGRTPFLCAAKKGQLAIAKLLKERGANIYAKIENGSNALHFACQSSGNVEMVNWLLDICKLQKEARGGNQKTPFLDAAEKGKLAIAKLLKERKANIYAKDKDGDNALHYACLFSGSVEMITWLLDECKLGLETKGLNQKTPFLCAAEKGQLAIAKLLRQRGADIHAKDKVGDNALHYAKQYSNSEAMINYLKELGLT